MYCPSSTRLGSISMSLTCSGVLRMSTEVMIELMQDDFPAPVAPEIRMWGISARLAMTARPGDVPAHGHFERVGGRLGLAGVEYVPQRHQLPGPIRHLDTDGRLARDGGQYPHVRGGHGVGDVPREAGDPRHLDPGSELQFEAGHRRPHRLSQQASWPPRAPPRAATSVCPATSSWRRSWLSCLVAGR